MNMILLAILFTILLLLGAAFSIKNADSEEAKMINEIKVKYPNIPIY